MKALVYSVYNDYIGTKTMMINSVLKASKYNLNLGNDLESRVEKINEKLEVSK